MKERPILFSAPMVRALLDGSKTQTRRIVKLPLIDRDFGCELAPNEVSQPEAMRLCPYGKPGDHLWVRETHLNWWKLADPGQDRTFSHVAAFAADGYQLQPGEKWIPSIHMLRAASRILLEITSVRVERLHDISIEDIIAEGLSTTLRGYDAECDLRDQWRKLWESTGGDWEANLWLWVIEFKRVTP